MEKPGKKCGNAPFDCGGDRVLFVMKANSFTPALLRLEAGGGVIRCRVDHKGLFIKQVEKLPKGAKAGVMALLEGRSLTARYEKWKFECLWLYGVCLGLDSCSGDLKEMIKELPDIDWDKILAAGRATVRKNKTGRQTVLYVDDEVVLTEMIPTYLKVKAPDLRVLTAFDGLEALQLLCSEQVDMLILNLQMPVMDGYQVLKVMQKDTGLRKIPVLISTATDYKQSQFHYMALDPYGGMNGAIADGPFGVPEFHYMTDPFGGMNVEWQMRPFDIKDLMKLIRKMLREGGNNR